MINSKFKKSLVVMALSAGLVTGASATSLTFDDGFNGGTGVDFDLIDFAPSDATVTQVDDGDGFLTGVDSFLEIGGASVVSFNVGNAPVDFLDGYNLIFDYTFSGTAEVAAVINGNVALSFVDFSTGSGTLGLDSDDDGIVDINLMTGSLLSGDCTLSSTIGAGSLMSLGSGGCAADMSIDSVAAGYFFNGADDLATLANLSLSVSLDILGLDGLYFDYAAQEAIVGDGLADTQVFGIRHDGTTIINVPEPTSLALLGLGLLGFGAARKRRS